jgi:hypothetical protein
MCDWRGVFETSSVDAAVASLNATLQDATEEAISHGYNRKSKFSSWVSNTLMNYIIKKKSFHRRFKKKLADYFYDKFIFY